MKMGTIASPWRYDAMVDYAPQSAILRRPAILRYASWRAAFPRPLRESKSARLHSMRRSRVECRGYSGPNLTFGTRPGQRWSGRNRPEATIQDGCVHAEMSG